MEIAYIMASVDGNYQNIISFDHLAIIVIGLLPYKATIHGVLRNLRRRFYKQVIFIDKLIYSEKAEKINVFLTMVSSF
jgi:hypothetical protein